MNEKLVLQDLVDALSKKSNITKKDADLFFRELFQLILERIFEDDIVKIKDFGTFKLTAISSRESVDVNTGEKIEIPAHQRLTFLPDKMLKNLVNKPFSQFETILLDDNTNLNLVENEDFDEDFDENKIDELESISPQEDITPNTNPYHKSFVYTYTTNITDLTKDDTQVVSVSKEDLHLSKDTREENKVSDNKKPSSKIVIEKKNDIIDSSNRLIDIKPKPIKDKDIANRIVENKSDLLELDSEIETVENVVFSSPEIISPNVNSKTIEQNSQTRTEDNIEKETLERPLIPLDEELEQENLLENNSQKPTINNNLSEPIISYTAIEKDEQENDDMSFFNDSYNYNDRPTLNSKLKKYLPIIIILIIAFGFGVYQFIKLFDVKYEYEDFLGQKNLTLTDTLPLVNEAPTIGLDIDSVSSSVIESNESASDIPLESNLPSYIETEIDDTTKGITAIKQVPDTISKMEIQKSERVISPLFDIGVVNKGSFYLSKYTQTNNTKKEKENNDALNLAKTIKTSEKTDSSKSVYVTMTKGTTLRSLATNYYGNSAYWVYIYQANRAKLSNPSDIAIGMKILIPRLSDYGIRDPKNLDEIQVAKALETQLIKW